MKKSLAIICFLMAGFTFQSHSLFAQATATTTPVKLDEKTQKKVDKAAVDLAKDKQTLNKSVASYEKSLAKYNKNESKGSLSPNDIEKHKKAQEKALKDIEKLKKSIADNEAFLAKHNQK